jgi:mannose-1-phosphate guanylyltransferase
MRRLPGDTGAFSRLLPTQATGISSAVAWCGDLAISTDSAEHDLPIYTVERFLEKPDRSSAEEFLRHGGYYWNGGIFVSRVDVMLAEIERQMPDLYAALLEIERAIGTAAADSTLAAIWPHIRSISIDYGVMEGAQRVAMTPLEAGWNDVGSWDALESVLERDADDNYIAHGNALAVDSWGNIVFSEKANCGAGRRRRPGCCRRWQCPVDRPQTPNAKK